MKGQGIVALPTALRQAPAFSLRPSSNPNAHKEHLTLIERPKLRLSAPNTTSRNDGHRGPRRGRRAPGDGSPMRSVQAKQVDTAMFSSASSSRATSRPRVSSVKILLASALLLAGGALLAASPATAQGLQTRKASRRARPPDAQGLQTRRASRRAGPPEEPSSGRFGWAGRSSPPDRSGLPGLPSLLRLSSLASGRFLSGPKPSLRPPARRLIDTGGTPSEVGQCGTFWPAARCGTH